MRKFLREPLFHFLLIGGCLFVLSGLRGGSSSFQFGPGRQQSAKIVVTQQDVESLIASFTNLWRRPPTAQELNGLIEGRIREEVYYREALRLGLDRNDTVIRSRLQEKLEFLSQDVNAATEPSEEDLRDFLLQHPEKFRTGAKFTFRLVYLDAGRRGASTIGDAQGVLAKLRVNPDSDLANMGDPLPYPNNFENMTENDVVKMFGDEFAEALSGMELKNWSGPVKSEDGAYLVYIGKRIDGRLPALEGIRPDVRREWLSFRRQDANDKYYRNLLRGYTVSVDLPKGISAQDGDEGLGR